MLQALPVVSSSPSPCVACRAPCCQKADVPLTGHDVWRLVRTLGLPWEAFATYDERGFRLRVSIDGACTFLLALPDGWHRCGVHALRPSSCRLYPYHVQLLDDPPYAIELGAGAPCPPKEAAAFARRMADAAPLVDDELAEWALYQRVLRRWGKRSGADFARWALGLYDHLEPLRRGARADWQLAAYRLIATYPLA
jgi:Fe-S-cluster containining protein